MSQRERSRITVEQENAEEDATFVATKFEAGTSISVDGPVRMVVNQILIASSNRGIGDMESNCSVSLNYERTSKYDTHFASQVIISPKEEARLVEWLHRNGVDFMFETEEFRSNSLEEATVRGRCENCGEHFKEDTTWEITVHNEDDYDRHFCTDECFEEHRSTK